MSNQLSPNKESTFSSEVDTLQVKHRTLTINQHAREELKRSLREDLAELIYEADRIARQRGGDDIQSGDVEQAKAYLSGRARWNYWGLFLGSSAFGAGLAGLADALINQKGRLIVLYSVFIVLGLVLVFYAAPRR